MSEQFASVIQTRTDSTDETSWFYRQSEKWSRDIAFVFYQVRILMLALKHPLVPWKAKAIAGCAVAYIFSPIQLIPSFIPVIGQMDDLMVLFIGMKLLRKLTPDTILEECEARAGY